MKKKIITLPTNNSLVYKQILAFLNFILDISNQERNVLAELIKLNHEYIALPVDKRAKFILSTDMRKEMREFLEIEEKQFNVVVYKLKKKTYLGGPILNEDNIVHEGLLFKPDDEGFQIEINLINTISKPSVKKEKKKIEKKEKVPTTKLAKPSNGKDNIITENKDFSNITIS